MAAATAAGNANPPGAVYSLKPTPHAAPGSLSGPGGSAIPLPDFVDNIADIARAAQEAALHAIDLRGLASPDALLLLRVAATAANAALDAGHPVNAIHPPRRTSHDTLCGTAPA